jgi:hypothetical protein
MIVSVKDEQNKPYDADSGAPGPDAVYAADGPETANCQHWGHPLEAHCWESVTNITFYSHAILNFIHASHKKREHLLLANTSQPPHQ